MFLFKIRSEYVFYCKFLSLKKKCKIYRFCLVFHIFPDFPDYPVLEPISEVN